MIDNEPHELDPDMSLGEFQEKYKEMSFVVKPTPEVHVPLRETNVNQYCVTHSKKVLIIF